MKIKVPSMGESITSATVSQILKESGSVVAPDDELIELETEKVNQVIYATKGGKLTLNVKVDQEVKIGEVIGEIEEGVSAPAKKEEKPAEKEAPSAPAPAPKPAEKGSLREGKEEFLAEKPQSVEEGEIRIEIAAGATAPGSRKETRQRLPKIRKVIAERLLHAVKTTAMLTTFNEVDMSKVMSFRAKHKESFLEKYDVKLGLMSFFVKAVVNALQAAPSFNSYLDGDDLVTRHYYDIGIAVGTERGLVVPVLRDCDKLSMADIEKRILDFATRARAGSLTADEMVGGGFTITNGGVYGSLLSTPILNPPQVGILGMHTIQERPVVVDGEIVIRKMMYLALSYDHRVVDGKEAVTFLVNIKKELEECSTISL